MARLASSTPARRIQELESISAHLQNLLSTTLGSCEIPGDAGLPPIADLIREFPAAADSLEACIQQTLSLHEPRLAIVSVRATRNEDEAKIDIEIVANLANQSGQALVFSTELDHRGHVELI